MSSPEDGPPYRYENGAAYMRIAELERELIDMRRAVSNPQASAIAALRIEHLREDRQEIVARYFAVRRALFVTTGALMIAAFVGFLRSAMQNPATTASAWIACGVLATSIALASSVMRMGLHARARTRCRSIDRNIAHEELAAGLTTAPVARAYAQVRVARDPLEVSINDGEAQLAEPAVRVAGR